MTDPARLALVHEILSEEEPIPQPKTFERWDALPIEDKRRLRERGGPDARTLPSEPTAEERAMALHQKRALECGYPDTFDEWFALSSEDKRALREKIAKDTRGAPSWYNPRSLPRVGPAFDTAAALRERAQAAHEQSQRDRGVVTPRSPAARPMMGPAPVAATAKSPSTLRMRKPDTFAEYDALPIEQKRQLRQDHPDFSAVALLYKASR